MKEEERNPIIEYIYESVVTKNNPINADEGDFIRTFSNATAVRLLRFETDVESIVRRAIGFSAMMMVDYGNNHSGVFVHIQSKNDIDIDVLRQLDQLSTDTTAVLYSFEVVPELHVDSVVTLLVSKTVGRGGEN